MAPVSPPAYLQAASYSANLDRLAQAAQMTPSPAGELAARSGVRPSAAAGMKVTQRTTPDMYVTVAAGTCYIAHANPIMGGYICHNDGSYDVAVPAAHATLARIDLVVARVNDSVDGSGTLNSFTVEVVSGTAASAPSAPAAPAQALALAQISVPAAATSVTTARITEARQATVALGGILPVSTATIPTGAYAGQAIYNTGTKQPAIWDGARFAAIHDDNYAFNFGVLANTVSPAKSDGTAQTITTTNASNPPICGSLTCYFTVPPNVPTTRRLLILSAVTVGVKAASTTRSGGTDTNLGQSQIWLDSAPWSHARRINVVADGWARHFSRIDIMAPPAAGQHSQSLRMWSDGADSVQFWNGEQVVVLL